MANTAVSSDLQVTKYLSEFGSNNVITIKEGRKKIEVPLVTRLKGNGVEGSATLRGNG
jgi:hypothetical protein